MREIDASQTRVIFIKGLQASDPRLAKISDLRTRTHILPGLQEVRTVPRNLAQWSNSEQAKNRLAYITRNEPSREYRQNFVDSAMRNAYILNIPDISELDISRMPPEARERMGNKVRGIVEAIADSGKN